MKTFKNVSSVINPECTNILFAQSEYRPSELPSNFVTCNDEELEGTHLYSEYYKIGEKLHIIRFYGYL